MKMRIRYVLAAVVIAVAPLVARAGGLDDAPFRVKVPDGDWKVDAAAPKTMGQGVLLVATVSNPRTHLKSFVLRETLQPPSDKALEELGGGIRASFTKRNVKVVADTATPFLGHDAKNFAYEMVHGTQTNYNATTVFVAAGAGWTITCVGRPEQSNEVQRIFSFYRTK
jgi:hypothetical protein